MQPLSAWFGRSYLRGLLSTLEQRAAAMRDSIRFDPGELGAQQFLRFTSYQELRNWLPTVFPPGESSPRIVEFGGSNEVIKGFLPHANYEIAPNWPEVDIQELVGYATESYDAVVLDHILEHVRNPIKAIVEVRRILKCGGVCICATPFVVRFHPCPRDYWRFTEDGLRMLFSEFTSVDIFAWGNRLTIESTLRWGWLDCERTKRWMRAALWNEDHWPIVYLTRAFK